MTERNLRSSAYGPFKIVNYPVYTKIFVLPWDELRFSSEGKIRFLGVPFAEEFDADGAKNMGVLAEAGSNHPAPGLIKNSLVCRIESQTYQCGKNTEIVVRESGFVILLPNDGQGYDNKEGWNVTVKHTYEVSEDPKIKIKRMFKSVVNDAEYDEAMEFIKTVKV